MLLKKIVHILLLIASALGVVLNSGISHALNDNFESGSFQSNWVNTGDRVWSVRSSDFVDAVEGSFAAVTTRQGGDDTLAILESTTNTNGGILSFFARTESRSSLNELEFSIDGEVVLTVDQTTPWTRYQFNLTPGPHTLSWVYDAGSSFFDGAAFIDNIRGPQQNIGIFNSVSEGETCRVAENSITVSDNFGRIDGLTDANFRVFVNGELTTDFELSFLGNGSPLNTAIVMDYSGSLSSTDEANAESAAAQFINLMDGNDRSSIVKFASTVEQTQALTSSRNALLSAAFQEPDVGGLTAFYDAVLRGVGNLTTTTGNRVVIAYTDGFENRSNATLQQMINTAINNDTRVFTVGLGGNIDEEELRFIASSTGGLFALVENSSDLVSLYQTLRSDAGEGQYMISLEAFLNSEIRIDVVVGGRTATITTLFTGCPVLAPIYEILLEEEEAD